MTDPTAAKEIIVDEWKALTERLAALESWRATYVARTEQALLALDEKIAAMVSAHELPSDEDMLSLCEELWACEKIEGALDTLKMRIKCGLPPNKVVREEMRAKETEIKRLESELIKWKGAINHCGCGHAEEVHVRRCDDEPHNGCSICGCTGYERAGAAGNALDDINKACGYNEWEYPGQVVRAVWELKERAQKAKDELDQYLNKCGACGKVDSSGCFRRCEACYVKATNPKKIADLDAEIARLSALVRCAKHASPVLWCQVCFGIALDTAAQKLAAESIDEANQRAACARAELEDEKKGRALLRKATDRINDLEELARAHGGVREPTDLECDSTINYVRGEERRASEFPPSIGERRAAIRALVRSCAVPRAPVDDELVDALLTAAGWDMEVNGPALAAASKMRPAVRAILSRAGIGGSAVQGVPVAEVCALISELRCCPVNGIEPLMPGKHAAANQLEELIKPYLPKEGRDDNGRERL